MHAVEILAEEHRAIECVLGCLERLLQTTVRADSLDAEAASEILDYLEHVADGSHQDKEELVLFPRLLARTSAGVRRSVERLDEEHRDERRKLEALRASLEGAAYGDPLTRDRFVALGGEYANMLRQHARWENEFLLPLAEEHLGEWEDAAMTAGYADIDERHFADLRLGPRQMLERIQRRGAQPARSESARSTAARSSLLAGPGELRAGPATCAFA